MGFKKIELSDFNEKDVSSIKKNPLIGDAVTNKQVFDKAAKEVLMPAFNALIDALMANDAAGQIGTSQGKLQDVLDGLSAVIATKVADEIAKVVADAPEDLNTLKELSDWIRNHAESAAEMNSAIAGKVDKVEGKVLSDNNYSNDDKAKVDGLTGANSDYTEEEKEKVTTAYTHSQTGHAPSDAEKNTIVTIKRNGTVLTPDKNRVVNISVPTNCISRGEYAELEGISLWSELAFDDGYWGEPSIGAFYSDEDDSRGLQLYGYNSDTDEEYDPILRGVGTPVDENDAANKAYVDSKASGGGSEDSPIPQLYIDSYIETNSVLDPVILTGGWDNEVDVGSESGSYVLEFSNMDLECVLIRNVRDPIYDQDAATKYYVDEAIAKLREQIDALNG